MAKENQYVKLWLTYDAYFEPLGDAEVGRLALAMMKYKSQGVEPVFSGNERFLWPAIKRDIDNAAAIQNAQLERDRENGRKGGRPKKSTEKENPGVFRETQGFSEKPMVKEKEKEKAKETETLSPAGESSGAHAPTPAPERPRRRVRQAFTPPTLAEVAAYCQERHNGIDPQHFLDYYTANGWVQGKGKPIQDWQATLRTWERNNTARPRQNATPTAAEYLAAPPSQSELESIRQMQEFMAKHGGGAGDNTGD